nr:reverse transcriptase domain-containing protein [Tanacetum cinerariifolium]GEW39267.1 reverse transcriptase domain-containing protein [Tanacetum cinerariifolium]
MRTHSSSNLVGESSPNPTSSNPKHCSRRRSKKPLILEESPVDTMADQCTMVELLRAPIEGYAEEIVVPPILAEHFERKHSLINMMTSDQFFGLEKDNPHDHIRWFNKITSTIKYKDVPNSEDLVSKFINEFFPPSRMTNLRNEISNFQQRFDEFHEAWDRYKDLLRTCLHHGFTEFHQLDTIYNALNPADQDSFNSAAGGNLLERRTQDVLTIIENKSKIRNSRNKFNVSQVKLSDANSSFSSEIAKLTHAVNQQTSDVTTAMTAILKQFQATPPPASVKDVEEIYVTCGGAHSYYQCLAADGNTSWNFGIILKDTYQQPWLTTITDPLHPNIPYPSRMHKQKQQDKDEIQIHMFWQMFKQLHINITLANALILILKYQKMLKALLSNKEKLLELANTPLNENCSVVTLKKLPEKLIEPGKFLIPCGFSELKCKALANLGASINLMPISIWKKLGLPELISNHMTLKLANQAICTSAGIARDVFVLVEKFTFPADFVIVDYESDPRVPLILGRHFFRALIDVHGEEMILRDDLLPPHNINPLSGSTTSSSSPNHLLEEFADELALITFSLGNDDLPFDIKSDLREIEYFLNHDPTNEMDSILEDLVDEDNLANPNDNLFDTISEMFTDEHTLDYSSPLIYDDFDDDLVEIESKTDDAYDDPFDSKEDKIIESKLLIDELDLPRSITVQLTPDKNVKKIAISHATLILEDFDPPLYELPFHKKVPWSETLLLFSFENEEKVFKLRIITSKVVHTSLLPELSHRGPKAFKVIKIFKIPIEIFPCSYGEDIRILDISCLHFYPS